ncbi:MAG: transaldolase [Candidatus Omnitrophota bacterium]
MSKTTIEKLAEFGQSIWLDNINRSMIESGKLTELIKSGLRGMTSNPTIFDKAISLTKDYDAKIADLRRTGKTVFEIYDDLTVKDVQDAADAFKNVYEKTGGLDGYVSLEVNPKLAFEVEATVKEAKRLREKVNRPNVMFKVPATEAGCKAIEELLACGININATLIFSVGQYMDTAKAYLRGIKRFADSGGDLSKTRSVASVFVSRVDTSVDKTIDELLIKTTDTEMKDKLSLLKGKAAVANSRLIFQKSAVIFSSKEFLSLKEKGANAQRVLWASTSSKNPAYTDIKYVSELIAKNTVNTLPDNTLVAFLDHGVVKETVFACDKEPQNIINDLMNFEIEINSVCVKLLKDGVIAFEKSFESLLKAIEEKAKTLCG